MGCISVPTNGIYVREFWVFLVRSLEVKIRFYVETDYQMELPATPDARDPTIWTGSKLGMFDEPMTGKSGRLTSFWIRAGRTQPRSMMCKSVCTGQNRCVGLVGQIRPLAESASLASFSHLLDKIAFHRSLTCGARIPLPSR